MNLVASELTDITLNLSSIIPLPFLPTAHSTLTIPAEGTPQSFALRKGDIKQYVAIKCRYYIVISSQVLFHDGSLLLSQINTQLLNTVHNTSRILPHV
jgi:hypothetical protein